MQGNQGNQPAAPGSAAVQSNVGVQAADSPAAATVSTAPQSPHLPKRGKNGVLTRAAMEEIITKGGGSVLHNGQILTHPSHIPSQAELAGNDAQATEDALRAIDERQKALNAERALITSRLKSSEVTTKSVPQQPATDTNPPTNPSAGNNPDASKTGDNKGGKK